MVVPFKGTAESLIEVRATLESLQRQPGDTMVIADNTPGSHQRSLDGASPVRVLQAAEVPTPGFARNRGAAAGHAAWIVFIDSDTLPAADLLDRYFDPEPEPGTALIGGGIRDEPVPYRSAPAARYAYLRGLMSQDETFRHDQWGFPKTANVAVRRDAFVAMGGFREKILFGEDADLCYRLRRAGWEVERREQAVVTHRNRQSVRRFLRQKALHGAALAWLNREYPESFPAKQLLGRRRVLRFCAQRMVAAIRQRDHDQLVWAVFRPLEGLADKFGRTLPNERPVSRTKWLLSALRLRDR